MAIHGKEKVDNTKTTGTETPTVPNPNPAPGRQTGPVPITFGGSVGGFINPNNVNTKVTKLANDIKEVYKEVNGQAEVNVFSNIITVSIIKDTDVYYYILVPEISTMDITVNAFIDSIINNAPMTLVVDYVSPEMHKYIRGELSRVYSNTAAKRIVSLDGFVIPSNIDTQDENLVRALSGTAYNICLAEAGIVSGEFQDLSVSKSVASVKGVTRLKQFALTQDTNDSFGRPTRTSWGVELTSPQSQGFMSALTQEEVVVSVKGYINILPKSYQTAYPGTVPQDKTGFIANIVINMIDQPVPTLGYALLGIASAAVNARTYNWVKPLLANPDGIGHLNKISNIFNDKANGKTIDLEKLKVSPEEKAATIIKLIDQGVTLSVDVPLLDPKITTLTPIATAAVHTNRAAVEAAEKDIINTLNILTDGRFGNIFKGQIFDGRGVVLPQGEFASHKGQMTSIDHIDAPYIMKNYSSGYMELLGNMMFSELGYNVDPFLERMKFMQKAGIDAKITGKKIRATFSSVFIESLLISLTESGLDPIFENTSVINAQTGLDFTAQYFNHAVLNNMPQFGHASLGQNQMQYNAAFQTMQYAPR